MAEQQQQQQPQQQNQKRTLPQSELDFALLTTDSVWGKPDVSPELKARLNRFYATKDADGKEGFTVESLWGLLGYYTRDMRLANLSVWNGELEYVRYYIDLAGDYLHSDQVEPFLVTLSRAATRLELSQSKGGFLRRQLNTITEENVNMDREPPKKSLFGMGKKDGEMR